MRNEMAFISLQLIPIEPELRTANCDMNTFSFAFQGGLILASDSSQELMEVSHLCERLRSFLESC